MDSKVIIAFILSILIFYQNAAAGSSAPSAKNLSPGCISVSKFPATAISDSGLIEGQSDPFATELKKWVEKGQIPPSLSAYLLVAFDTQTWKELNSTSLIPILFLLICAGIFILFIKYFS